MQFRLITLFIITGAVCVYLGILNAPPVIALPLFCAVVWLSPAYWVAGVIYSREARRAFFIGGLSAGAIPFLAMVFYSLVLLLDGPGPWGFRSSWGRGGFGQSQLINFFASLFIFAPLATAYVGGWISKYVYYSAQPPKPVASPASPFGPAIPKTNLQPAIEE
jgi:hypothetical protein